MESGVVGISRNTVAKAVSSEGPPAYDLTAGLRDSDCETGNSCSAVGDPLDGCDGVGSAGGLAESAAWWKPKVLPWWCPRIYG